MKSWLLFLVTTWSFVAWGCGGGDSSGDDVPDTPDQIAEDGDVVPGDDAAPDGDADDAGEVVGTDEDGDTFPEGVDCDDHDPLVYPGTRRPCASACGTGTERCEAGAWVGCTATTDCACDPPGATRLVDCGWCGQAGQRCGDGGIWEMPAECMYEGECFAGELGSEPCGFCGARNRLCSPTCTWLAWTDCEHPGDCDPADRDPVLTAGGCPLGEFRRQACSTATCTWETVEPCGVAVEDCTLPRRTDGYAEEICVPGGPFLMGTDDPDFAEGNCSPMHGVYLSPFFIDKYKVTNGRYRACVAAGECTEPYWITGSTYYRDPPDALNDYPVLGVTYAQAREFCAWDGGRELPTEAQWEKASRGPSPRQVLYPWGDDPDPCAYAAFGPPLCATMDEWYPVDAFPLGASFYGVFQLAAETSEWVRDYFRADWFSSMPEVDPEQTAPATERSVRGFWGCGWVAWETLYPSHSIRTGGDPAIAWCDRGIRCSRDGR